MAQIIGLYSQGHLCLWWMLLYIHVKLGENHLSLTYCNCHVSADFFMLPASHPFFISLCQAGSFIYFSFLQLFPFYKTYFFPIHLSTVLLIFCFYCSSLKFDILILSVLCVLSDHSSNIEDLANSFSLSLILYLSSLPIPPPKPETTTSVKEPPCFKARVGK